MWKNLSTKKIFLLDNFLEKSSNLFLYEGHEEKYHTFRYFLECGLKNSEFCCYVYPRESEKLNFEHYLAAYGAQMHCLPIAEEKIKTVRWEHMEQVKGKIKELHTAAQGHAFRILIDFEKILNSENFSAVVELEKEIHGLSSTTMSAFDSSLLDQETVNELIKLHERVIISANSGANISFCQTKELMPSVKMISSKSMEQCVKNSLDAIILSLLNQKPMCGFDIIKTIVHNFKVLLSQGTVYPILYSLKEKGYLETQTLPDNKTMIYIPTEAGKKYIEEQIRDYLLAQENIFSLIAKGLKSQF